MTEEHRNSIEIKRHLRIAINLFFCRPRTMREFSDLIGELYHEMIDQNGSLEWYDQWFIVRVEDDKKREVK